MSVSPELSRAVEFDVSNRAHGSVHDDAFYVAPSDSHTAEPGTLLKVENVTDTSLYTIPPGLSLSRFIYQSQDASNRPVPVSGYILWPYAARQHSSGGGVGDGGSRGSGVPCVAWAHGTSGISAECAPSNIRHLWHHFQAPFQLALAGYAVVATDYAGLGVSKDATGRSIVHEYATGPAQASDVFYAIKAAKAAYPQLADRFVVMGHSQGGGAAWAAAEKLAAEPIAGHLGTVAVAPLTRVLDIPTDYGVANIAGLAITQSIANRDPTFDPDTVVTAKGKQMLQTVLDVQGSSNILFHFIDGEGIMKDGWPQTPAFQEFQKLAQVGRQALSGPLLVIHGANDRLIPLQVTTDAVEETARMFPSAQIEYHVLSDIDHVPALSAGQLVWQRWIDARFAGEPLKEGLQSHTAQPLRPASSLQPVVNWHLAFSPRRHQQT